MAARHHRRPPPRDCPSARSRAERQPRLSSRRLAAKLTRLATHLLLPLCPVRNLQNPSPSRRSTPLHLAMATTLHLAATHLNHLDLLLHEPDLPLLGWIYSAVASSPNEHILDRSPSSSPSCATPMWRSLSSPPPGSSTSTPAPPQPLNSRSSPTSQPPLLSTRIRPASPDPTRPASTGSDPFHSNPTR